jgi:hypothetical protein
MSERALDAEKHRATVSMAAARDRAISRTRVVAEQLYHQAHHALMNCKTDDEVDRVERGFNAGMIALRRSVDDHDT